MRTKIKYGKNILLLLTQKIPLCIFFLIYYIEFVIVQREILYFRKPVRYDVSKGIFENIKYSLLFLNKEETKIFMLNDKNRDPIRRESIILNIIISKKPVAC